MSLDGTFEDLFDANLLASGWAPTVLQEQDLQAVGRQRFLEERDERQRRRVRVDALEVQVILRRSLCVRRVLVMVRSIARARDGWLELSLQQLPQHIMVGAFQDCQLAEDRPVNGLAADLHRQWYPFQLERL